MPGPTEYYTMGPMGKVFLSTHDMQSMGYFRYYSNPKGVPSSYMGG